MFYPDPRPEEKVQYAKSEPEPFHERAHDEAEPPEPTETQDENRHLRSNTEQIVRREINKLWRLKHVAKIAISQPIYT